ncbi:MAG: hypothetical protein H6P98_3200 [Candidatus Aminicenantes bacterium]|nr:hypothetical protein [Candidatus Aminicenantes bacterium]
MDSEKQSRDPDAGGALQNLFDRPAGIEVVLGPLELIEGRPAVGRGVICQGAQFLDDQTLLIHPTQRELPAELVKGHASVFGRPAQRGK